MISSLATGLLPGDPRIELIVAIFYLSLGPALGVLGGLTIFANGLINKEFVSFRLTAIKRVKQGEERITRLSETDRLRLAWFLFWRGLGMGALVDVGFVVAIVVLLYPFAETAAARTAAFYVGRAAASSLLLLSTLFVGFPLTIPQLVQKTFGTSGATFTFKVVSLGPVHRELEGLDAQV